LLVDDAIGDRVHPPAAILLRYGRAEYAEFTTSADDIDRERPVLVVLLDDRYDLFVDKVSHGCANHSLLFAQQRGDIKVIGICDRHRAMNFLWLVLGLRRGSVRFFAGWAKIRAVSASTCPTVARD